MKREEIKVGGKYNFIDADGHSYIGTFDEKCQLTETHVELVHSKTHLRKVNGRCTLVKALIFVTPAQDGN